MPVPRRLPAWIRSNLSADFMMLFGQSIIVHGRNCVLMPFVCPWNVSHIWSILPFWPGHCCTQIVIDINTPGLIDPLANWPIFFLCPQSHGWINMEIVSSYWSPLSVDACPAVIYTHHPRWQCVHECIARNNVDICIQMFDQIFYHDSYLYTGILTKFYTAL